MSLTNSLLQPPKQTGTHRPAKPVRQGIKPSAPGRATRPHGRVLGNILMAFGLGLVLFIGATYAYSYLEDWLDAQQRYVAVSSIDDWPLHSIVPATSLTLTSLPATVVPTPTGLPDPLPTTGPRQAPVVTATLAVTAPVRIVIPKINVNSRIVEVAPLANGTWGTAAYAVAYHKGTGRIGEADNIILSGHNNFQGEVFRRLSELKAGDPIKLYTADREYPYVVTEAAIIPWTGASAQDRRRHIQYLLPTPEPTLTLISCWPYWVYTHRVYIVAKPMS